MTNGRAAVFANEFNRYRAMPGKPAAVECVRVGCAAVRDLILFEEERAPGFRSEWLSTFCSVCDCRQFTAPGGATCAHGHGGAEGIYPKEIP